MLNFYTLEKPDIFDINLEAQNKAIQTSRPHSTRHDQSVKNGVRSEAQILKATMSALGGLHGKIRAELTFAKREMAYGKLDAADLEQIFKLSRDIFIPTIGIASIADIFERVADCRELKPVASPNMGQSLENDCIEMIRSDDVKQWNEIMRSLHNPFKSMTEAMNAGLQHALYTLELIERPKRDSPYLNIQKTSGLNQDIEA